MTAFNVVRMRPRPDRLKAFLAFHEARDLSPMEGMRAFHVVDTGGGEYLFVGEWESMEALAAARPAMIASLDQFRVDLQDLGGGLGVTDPRSGEAVVSRTV